jgi:hypothetical protein
MIYDTKEQMQAAAKRFISECNADRESGMSSSAFMASVAGRAVGYLHLMADEPMPQSFFTIENGEARLKT